MKQVQLFFMIILFSVSAGCMLRSRVSLPKDVAIITREEWGAEKPALPVHKHVPLRITIHHTAVKQNPDRAIAEKLKALQKFSFERSTMSSGKIKDAWADIPYHFYIAVDGIIGEGRELQYVGESNTPYDPTGHALIVLEGNFENEEVSEEQYQSLQKLVISLTKRYHISSENISGHKDHASTACPGKNLYALIPKLKLILKED